MTDSQWARFEVFVQDKAGKPFRNAGTVHAADAEMALLNGRDVFGRRPSVTGMWVAPAEAVTSWSAEQVAVDVMSGAEDSDGPPALFHVFQKRGQRRSATFVVHVGTVTAVSPPTALAAARTAYGGPDIYVTWVVPDTAFTRSRPEDADSFFEPARDKVYKLPNQYRTVVAMQRLRQDMTEDSNERV